tara:strand:- start:878 stop:1195 length:318 start_codon:yes stop_codon:yes gene_type:complete
MKKLFKYLFVSLILLNGCQSVKDGLSGNKKNTAEEFLVEKKNPLVLPPDFDKLPKPGNIESKDLEEGDINLENIIGKSNVSKTKPKNKNIDGSLENIILEKINKD